MGYHHHARLTIHGQEELAEAVIQGGMISRGDVVTTASSRAAHGKCSCEQPAWFIDEFLMQPTIKG